MILFGAGCVAMAPNTQLIPTQEEKSAEQPVLGEYRKSEPSSAVEPAAKDEIHGESVVPSYPEGAIGFAISYPQCRSVFPKTPFDFGIVGVTGGRSFKSNPCFAEELAWAKKGFYAPSFYINLDYPNARIDPYAYGQDVAKYAFESVKKEGAGDAMWWLDVQIVSTWSKDTNVNAQVARGAIDFFKKEGLPVGLSTTPYQWKIVMGNLETKLPVWVPGRVNKYIAAKYCTDGIGYSGGRVLQTAYVENNFEVTYACGEKN